MGRLIFLVDMNAFYISCETVRNPSLKGRPAAVAGDPQHRSGIILTANYEARKYGVKTTMVLHEAKKLCPDLVLVPPDHDFYEKKSKEVMSILSQYTPVIEQNSIDEAWLDLTGCEALFGSPMEIARKIMNAIENELGLWCSIGISENKFLAKMASDMKKPHGITELWKSDIQKKLWPLPTGKMYGIGRQTEAKLTSLGIFTIGDIAASSKEFLEKRFGKYGSELYLLANGIDESVVASGASGDIKSISRSTTLPKDITDIEEAKRILFCLADEVGMDARRHDKKGKTVSITIKYADFTAITRQKSLAPTFLTGDIYEAGEELLCANWNSYKPVRLLGIGISGFSGEDEAKQLSIFNLMEVDDTKKKKEKLEKTIDNLRMKYGMSKINRAMLLEKPEKYKPEKYNKSV